MIPAVPERNLSTLSGRVPGVPAVADAPEWVPWATPTVTAATATHREEPETTGVRPFRSDAGDVGGEGVHAAPV